MPLLDVLHFAVNYAIPIGLLIWLIVRAVRAQKSNEELSRRLDTLELELFRLKRERESARPVEPAPAPQPIIVPPVAPPVTPQPPGFATPPPIPRQVRPALVRLSSPPPISPEPSRFPLEAPSRPAPPPPIQPAVNWEQFMGVKLFAWLGGLALFIGVAFFVKYSFDNNLVPPALRVALGFLAGLGLLAGGVVMSRKNFPTLSQTLCATGVVILYAVTYACYSVYKFDFFQPIPTFLLMALITATAFLLAVRLDALVVAILGMLGGFLTPVLLSTHQDNPLGLFGYIAILDIGLILVALRRRWFFLVALAALGTAILQIAWAAEFFVAGRYFYGNKILVALAVLPGFNALFVAAAWRAKFQKPADGEDAVVFQSVAVNMKRWFSGSAIGLAAVALAFSAWFLSSQMLAQRPALMFGFIFLVDLLVTALVLADESVAPAQAVAGLAVFGLLGFWTQEWLSTNEMLNTALAFYFVFALMHSALPPLLQRWRGQTARGWTGHLFPLLALILVLLPLFKLAEVSFIVWPFILLVDALAVALAVLTAALIPVVAALLLTLVAIGALIFRIPPDLGGLTLFLFLLGAFVVFFIAVSVWIELKFKPAASKTGTESGDAAAPGEIAAMLPACSVVFPFLLLIMATLRLPLADPSPVFGLALLLVLLLMAVTRLFSLDWMPVIGLGCLVALECAWHFNHFDHAKTTWQMNLALTWYLVFFALFALFPFLFLRQFAHKAAPWAAAAMAGPPQFFLIHRLVDQVYPNHFMGLLPAAFAVPGLLSLAVVLKKMPPENKSRMAQVAWFGGVALFFITLIFPVQFHRQWITLGWALEGAALLWLYHRVPHPGLRLTGLGLLAAAFARLALNPAVLDYARAATPVFNWYLYSYGVVTACLFAGAKLLAPPRNVVWECNVPPMLAGLGTILAFLLLNIEIADYFSAPGSRLTFEFSGNSARDMTYSIAWALFALALLVAGIVRKMAASRYAAMGLLCVTLLKLFFHDLAQRGQLFRIGAFIGVAVITILASYAYQKFFSAGQMKEP